MTDEPTTEIDLIKREHDYETKCGMCGFRTTVLWNLGRDEPAELAACGSCTTQHLAANDEYTIVKLQGNDKPA